jgi:hypothetical protein
VFSLVVRDLLAGFAYGFVGSKTPAPKPLKGTYGTMTSQLRQANAKTAYKGVQPGAPNYNQWAAAFFDVFLNQVYGFQYSDFFGGGPAEQALLNPLMTLKPSVPVQLSIMDGRPEN